MFPVLGVTMDGRHEGEGEPGAVKLQVTVPIGTGAVLLGGTIDAANLSVLPKVGPGEHSVVHDGVTITVVPTLPVATNPIDPELPSFAEPLAVISSDPLCGQLGDAELTHLNCWASHCWIDEIDTLYPDTDVMFCAVPPTVKLVGDSIVEVPSLTLTVSGPLTPLGTANDMVQSPGLVNRVATFVADADPTSTLLTPDPNPVTKTVTDVPTGPLLGMGALTSWYGLGGQFWKMEGSSISDCAL